MKLCLPCVHPLPTSAFIHPTSQSAHSNYFSPTQGKLLPYRLAVLLQHSSDKVPSTLLFLLLRGIGISMSIKADLVLCLFSHTPSSRPYQWSYIRAGHGTRPRAAEVNNGQRCPTSKTEGLRSDANLQLAALCGSLAFSEGAPAPRGKGFVKLRSLVQVALVSFHIR